MAQKTRTGIDQTIGQNIYDNNAKEILAAMVRDVLADFRDSYFNLLDDQLQNLKFNETQTLKQYLDTIAGSVPKFGQVLDIDIGAALKTFTTNGIISSASSIERTDNTSNIEINFSESIEGKRIIPVYRTRSQAFNDQVDLLAPSVFYVSSTRIKVGIAQNRADSQSLDLEIIVL